MSGLHQTRGRRANHSRMGRVIVLEKGVGIRDNLNYSSADFYFSLAYAEMRLVLTKILWNFDAELQDDSKAWDQGQKINMYWEKGSMNVKLIQVIN